MARGNNTTSKGKLSLGGKIVIFILWVIFINIILNGETIPSLSLYDMPALIGLFLFFLPLLLKPLILLVAFIVGVIRKLIELSPRIAVFGRKLVEITKPISETPTTDDTSRAEDAEQPTDPVQDAPPPECTTENSMVAINGDYDELLPDAIDMVLEFRQASVPTLQRKFKLGYSRAACMVDQMEELGVVGPYEGPGPRKVLITQQQWADLKSVLPEHCASVGGGARSVLREIEDLEEMFRSSYAFAQERLLNARECALMFQKVKKDFLAVEHSLAAQLRFEQLCEEYEPKFAKPNSMLYVDAMNGADFEYWCAGLLKENGFQNVETTKGSNDQGVDLLAEKGGIKYAIQCKRYSSDLGNTPIQEVNAGKMFYRCHVGAVMTNRHFTRGAREMAEVTGTLLWDRDVLQSMIDAAESSSRNSSSSPTDNDHFRETTEMAGQEGSNDTA